MQGANLSRIEKRQCCFNILTGRTPDKPYAQPSGPPAAYARSYLFGRVLHLLESKSDDLLMFRDKILFVFGS